MSNVRIVQALCPARHCILSTAYQSEDGNSNPAISERLRQMLYALIQAHAIDPWCGICHSRDFHYEDSATIFATMEKAVPALRDSEEQQRRTAALIHETKN